MSSLQLKPKYFFGKGSIFESKDELLKKGYKKALVLYGGGSVKKNNSFNDLIKMLKEINLDYVEFSGIEPNPKSETIDKCVQFSKDKGIDVIFAIGGGSVIDASKVIGSLIANGMYKNSWDYCLDNSKAINKSIDIVAIITLAGTASENNSGSVVTNSKTNEKIGVFSPSAIPTITIQDPTYTCSVNEWQTASGIFDCFSHITEQLLGQNTYEWTKNYLMGNLKTLIKYAKNAVDNPNDFESRSNILWTTSMSLNELASFQSEGDWTVHTIEHGFSGLWNITHGAGLAFITPTYWKIKSQKDLWFKNKIIEIGKEIFNANGLDETINKLVEWIVSIKLPTKWCQFDEIKNISDKDVEFLIEHSIKFNYSPSGKELISEVVHNLANLK